VPAPSARYRHLLLCTISCDADSVLHWSDLIVNYSSVERPCVSKFTLRLTATLTIIDVHAFTVQHIEIPFSPYDRTMLDVRLLCAVCGS